MCNLSQGIKEEGIAIGETKGRAEGEAQLILNMHDNGLASEQIAAYTNKSIDAISAIIENRKPSLD